MVENARRCEISLVLGRALGHHVGGIDIDSDDGRIVRQAMTNCRGLAECMHERRKRSDQGSLTNPQNLMAACSPCNTWVEDQPRIAHALKLVVRRGDDEFASLAR